jgi:hypothetical protein
MSGPCSELIVIDIRYGHLFPAYRCCGTAACLHNSTEVYLYLKYRVRIPRSGEAGLHAFDSEQGLACPQWF